jgi:hypothetical protein
VILSKKRREASLASLKTGNLHAMKPRLRQKNSIETRGDICPEQE